MKPGRGQQFNADEFLSGQNTLYLIGTGAGESGGFLGAVLDDVVARGRARAMTSAGGRLELPLGLVLDEIVNMFSWAELPTMVADGGGIGISSLVVVQAMSQAKSAWSEAEAVSIWSAATAKIFLGVAADVAHLRDVEAMLNARKMRRSSATYSENGDSSNVQTDREPLMTVDELRRMPERIGLLA
jgi:type IV secretion system protein VirD4